MISYTNENIQGKRRVNGGEAPSARVYLDRSNQHIIGMMAVNVQLIVSLYSIEEENCKEIIVDLEEYFKDEKKLNLIFVVKNSFEVIEAFKIKNNIVRSIIVQDSKDDFGKKFGVMLNQDEFKEHMANGVFIIDKEAQIKYRNHSAANYFRYINFTSYSIS